MLPVQTILHPTDFSESAEHAFRLACSLARDHAARLVVLHVVKPSYPIVGEMLVVPPLGSEEGDEAERLRMLAKLKARTPTYGGFPVEYRAEIGEPVESILDAVEDTGAGLVVMGTHGRTGLKRMLMGSVAEQIVRTAPCSVLTVKTPTATRFADMPKRELAAQH